MEPDWKKESEQDLTDRQALSFLSSYILRTKGQHSQTPVSSLPTIPNQAGSAPSAGIGLRDGLKEAEGLMKALQQKIQQDSKQRQQQQK